MLLRNRDTLPDKVLDERLKEFGLLRFAAYMSCVCIRTLGEDESLLTPGIKAEMVKIDGNRFSLFTADMFCDEYIGFTSNSLKDRVKRGVEFLGKAWKLREFLGVSPARFVFDKFVGLFGKPYVNK